MKRLQSGKSRCLVGLNKTRVADNVGHKYRFRKASARSLSIEEDEEDERLFWGGGYWTRSNTEPCLLCTRGDPHRLAFDVR